MLVVQLFGGVSGGLVVATVCYQWRVVVFVRT